ncbi:hypothetical protein BOTBODRAFT_186692 [Botryobasidium botryosum FD-172 SS1]|uniref:Hyaluronan/mRNA-binding protein domain-containing protein n=1 Tax=Botryobasidium botryosum (strain FD-172 SS1) TaxID=930990 RepID=A0A067MLF8_BOTB1|nr:hypothetical protein BOTBODRAFT_186692 [Botryobasidium botryosum FD-172 SS1]
MSTVASKNPFDILAQEETPPSAPATTKPTAAATPAAAKAAQQKKSGPASRSGGYYNRGGAPKATTRDEEPVAEDTGRFDRTENRPDRGRGGRSGRGRGAGRGRGGGGGGGGGEYRGRQYDKHSQTGLTDSDKKISNSWGGPGNEFAHENQARADAAADAAAAPAEGDASAWEVGASAGEWGTPAAGEEAAAQTGGAAPAQERTRPPRQEEEEDNTLTLDEYLAKKANDGLASLVPKLEGTRATNDGNDELWKDAIKISKEEEEETYFAGKTKAPPKPRAKKEEKVHIEINARFPPPERGGRGGRGGDRGGRGGDRGNGAGRGARRDNNGPRSGAPRRDVDLDDQSAFPSLA